MRILLPHLIDLHVLPIEDIFEIVVVNKVEDPIRCDVPGPRNLYLPECLARLGRLLDDLLCQEESGALTSEFPVATRRKDDSAQEFIKVFDVYELGGYVNEFAILGEKAPNQRDSQALLG